MELQSMFSDSNYAKESQYEKVQWVQLSDEQGGTYDAGQVSFNTQSMGTSNVVTSESIFALPITIGHDADRKITVKNAILSLIQGLTVDSVAGTSIVSEQLSTPVVANLRLLLDSTIGFHDSNELFYAGKDQYIMPSVRPTLSSEVGGVQPRNSGKQATIDPFHNSALATRISVFDVRANAQSVGAPAVTINGTTYTGSRQLVALIPLKFIHDFFAQRNFPLPNLALRITFNIAGVAGYQTYCPWTCPTFAAHRTLGDPDVATPLGVLGDIAGGNAGQPTGAEMVTILGRTLAPAVSASVKPGAEIAKSAPERTSGWVTKPCLYLKTVYFKSEDAKALAAKIAAGYDHPLTYTVSNYYPTVQSQSHINQPIGQGLIRPTRVWAFPLPTGTLASEANCFPAHIGPNGLKNVNIQLNGNNFYNMPFRSQYELFREFKTQLIGGGSMSMCSTPISYTDWILGMNPYCFDLSRNPTVQANQDCRLTFEADAFTLATGQDLANPYDLCIVVERLKTCVIHVSAGGVSILTRDGADA